MKQGDVVALTYDALARVHRAYFTGFANGQLEVYGKIVDVQTVTARVRLFKTQVLSGGGGRRRRRVVRVMRYKLRLLTVIELAGLAAKDAGIS